MARKTGIVPEARREVGGVIHRADGLKYLSPLRASAFLGLVRAGSALDRELDAELERTHGIGLRGFEVLLFLAVFAPGGTLRIGQLIERTPLSQSRVSRLVGELEARGLVERSTADGDRRAVRVSITPHGIETFRAAQDTHLAGLERRLFSRLTEGEIRQLAKITTKLLREDGSAEAPGRS
ncbi:MAG TPA: MarR family transcriptional regulator [Streptosporangiaceae bacterium]